MTVSKNSIDLNIGGAVRTLKFGMNTQEFFINETTKGEGKNLDLTNPITKKKFLIYCGLIVGDRGKNILPINFDLDMLGDWIDDCEDEAFDSVNEFAGRAMGFIIEAEEMQYKTMGIDRKELMEKQLQEIMKEQKKN